MTAAKTRKALTETPPQTAPGPAPVRHRIDVPLPPGPAFDLFTRDIARWWPRDGGALPGAAARRVRLQPREGGALIAELADGSIARWATVTTWAPGRRLGLAWHEGQDEDEASEVTVVFARIEGGTRVELTHAGFGRTGAPLALACARGWPHLLVHRYGPACRSCVPA